MIRLEDCYADTPARVQRALNQIKHTADSFGRSSQVPVDLVRDLLAGGVGTYDTVFAALSRHPAIDVTRLIPPSVAAAHGLQSPAPRSFVVMRSHDTKASARVFHRGASPAAFVPYYRYFDTAVQATSPFRPELIEQLVNHDAAAGALDPSYFNHGHFESQLTVYLGDVDLHWLDRGGSPHVFSARRFSASYKLPFVRHTFTGRMTGGAILAVTYLGPLADGSSRPAARPHAGSGTALEPVVTGHVERPLGARGPVTSLLPPIPSQPSTRVLLLQPRARQAAALPAAGIDRWMYHAGGSAANVEIDGTAELLAPGDSMCIAPARTISVRSEGSAEVVCFEVRSGEGDAAWERHGIELGVGPEALLRLEREDRQWFG